MRARAARCQLSGKGSKEPLLTTCLHAYLCNFMALTFRDAVESDADSIFQVHTASIRQLCSAHYSKEQISAWIGRQRKERYSQLIARNDDFVVAEDSGGQVIAFGHLGPCTDSERFSLQVNFEVYGFYVSPLVTRQGVGRRLMAELERRALAQGCVRLGVCSTLTATPFYEACGFVVCKNSHCHSLGGVKLEYKVLEKSMLE